MCGVNQFVKEYGITDEQIIGVVSKITRNGKSIDAKDFSYRLYADVWASLTGVRYPVRRLRVKGYRALKAADACAPGIKQQADDRQDYTRELSCEASYLIALVGALINSTQKPPVPPQLDAERLFKIAKAHRVTGLCAHSGELLKSVPEQIAQLFKKELYKTVARSATQKAELKKIIAEFEREGIAYCVLKGAAITELYPSEDMRSSLDCDIYVNPCDTERAAALITALGYERGEADGAKDIAFMKMPFMTVELHYALSYETDMTHAGLTELEQRLVPAQDNPLCLTMTREDLYLYTLAHTAHHFLTAGTGLRSVADDYLMRKKLLPQCDADYINTRLEQLGLKAFAAQLKALGDYWFGSGQKDAVMPQLEQYIIRSGVYGTDTEYYINITVASSALGGSRSKYILRRIFPSRTDMAAQYPALRKNMVLLPYYWAVRCAKVLVNPGRYTEEASSVAAVDEKKRREREEMFKNLF